MRIGMLFDRVAAEEKLLLAEFENKQTNLEMIDVRTMQLRLDDPRPWQQFDVIFDRSVSYSKALASLQIFSGWQIPTVNTAAVAEVCGNKLATSVALVRHSVPTPAVAVAFTPESALEAIERIGYPVVLKPLVGSWGRLLSKINDRDAAETILEHKSTLGSYNHSVFYIQQYVAKAGGQDIRSFVVDGKTICAICRTSSHWVTNTARGATASNFPLTDLVCHLSEAAAEAVGGGLLAIDLFQDQQGNWFVNEVNHSMEFRNSIQTTGVNIPEKMVEYVINVGSGHLVS
jgi:[lysine-biosynthesis-protein LysW]--L-2-aminoadipate ligase